jgi:hypothetical protein
MTPSLELAVTVGELRREIQALKQRVENLEENQL